MAATGWMDDHKNARMAATGGMDHRKMPQNDHKNARMASTGGMNDRRHATKWLPQGGSVIIKMLKSLPHGGMDDRKMPQNGCHRGDGCSYKC